MDSLGPGGEGNNASRKERRKIQNTIAQRKYRNKLRDKTRELERLLSTALTSTSQAHNPSATPGPEPWFTSSQPFPEQALRLGDYRDSKISSEMTPQALVAAPPFDSSTFGNFSLDNNLTSDGVIRISQPSPSSNIQLNHSRNITESLSANGSPTGGSSFYDSAEANIYGKDVLLTDALHSINDSQIASSNVMLTASQILSYLYSDSERISLGKIIGSEELNLRDIVKLGLASLGVTMEETQYDSANGKPAKIWINEVSCAYAPYDIQLAAWTGIRVILQMTAQSESDCLPYTGRRTGDTQQRNIRRLPDIYTNTITLKSSPWMSASAANAELLRIPLESLFVDSSESPFTQQGNPSLSSQGYIGIPFQVKEITSDMAPTLVQYTKSHHPYLDLIPWPTFRSKAIIATCVTPPLIDEEDLCLDLMNDALRCWGSMRSQHGRGEGAPWDMRSWEAAQWFIEKWAMLIDGDGGEIARNSAWWRNQRGMPSFN